MMIKPSANFLFAVASLGLLAACDPKIERPPMGHVAPATAPATDSPASTPTSTKASYVCRSDLTLDAVYAESGSSATALLTISGQRYELTNVVSASGARYFTDQGRAPGKTLVWWTKGDNGTLYEGKVGGAVEDETELTSCSERKG